MGSTVPPPSPEAVRSPAASSPETLARVVLRCRELAAFLEASRTSLPARGETPFLHGQLHDALQRLQTALQPFQAPEAAPPEKPAGFLSRWAAKKPREAPKKSEPRYDLEGNAWTIPVTELVNFFSHTGKSGLLWVTSSNETFVLEFERGHLVHATSNAPPVAYRLGEILLREKFLEPDELTALIQSAKAADDLLGNYLVRSGRMKHAELQRALAIQVQQLFHRLMDAESALFRFQEGAQLVRSNSLEVNITQLLLESARKKDEERQISEARERGEADPRTPEAELSVLDEPAGPAPEPDPALPSERETTRLESPEDSRPSPA